MGDYVRRPRPAVNRGFRGRGAIQRGRGQALIRQNHGGRGNHQDMGHRGGRNPAAVERREANNPREEIPIRGNAREVDNARNLPRPMNERRMRELEAREPTEVLLTLLDNREGFKELIGQTNLSRDKIRLIVSLLSRACRSDQKENLRALLKFVHSVHQFTVINLQFYLCDFQTGNFVNQPQETLANLMSFLETTQDLEPEMVTTTLLLPHLKDTFHAMETRLDQELKNRFDVLQDKREQFKMKNAVTFLNQTPYHPPPDDFRNIPLFPDIQDLYGKRPFLTPNIVEGRYKDTEHYLDTQYRLLREDFVRPLREGIVTYVSNINTKVLKKFQNIRVYTNVHLNQALMTENGIIQEVTFDVTPFRRIRWETNRRLIFGSLLCFSDNDFDTMMFGTVATRTPQDLAKGKVHVKFEDLQSLPVKQKSTYVMLETEAYFEAYRHNLTALQFIDERVLPFKKFIVELSREIAPPSYLQKMSRFCLQPILDAYSDKYVLPTTSTGTLGDLDKSACDRIYRPCKHTSILSDSTWPTYTDMGLNPSQYGALKLALTNQLAIIQGPPGTGKTHVGLKIIHALFQKAQK